jgi:hypothetical protein
MRRVGSSPEKLNFIDISLNQKNAKKKYRWVDQKTGHHLTAGGILFYDDHGVWLLGERDKHGVIYTDIGGKYNFEDCNIYATIARELGEETYHTCEATCSQIKALAEAYSFVYVNGHQNLPVYACVVVHISQCSFATLDSKKFIESRHQAILENPHVPPDRYKTLCLTYFTFENVKKQNLKLSFRLKRILRHSRLGSNFSPSNSVLLDE